MLSPPTKSQVNKAGKILRRHLTDAQPPPDRDRLSQADRVLYAFREAHQNPLVSAQWAAHKAGLGPATSPDPDWLYAALETAAEDLISLVAGTG